MRIELTGFLGANKALHPKLLPAGVGTESLNQRPGRGDLRPWHAPLPVATVPATTDIRTIYRMGRDVPSEAQYWLAWQGVVHCMRSFDAADTGEKTYYTGDGVPKWTTSALALGSQPYPQAWRPLGVPAPISAPLVTVATDTSVGTIESRYYFSTFITDQGEESQPSPPSLVAVCHPGAILNISALEAPPSGQTIYTARRIYVTSAGTSGAAQALFLREIAIGQTETVDDGRDRGEVMPSIYWNTPPADGKWLTALWNGFAAMLSGKSIRFSEVDVAYAWPIGYELIVNDTAVALVAFDQQLVVLTTGKPYLITGTDPASMTMQQLSQDAPCIAERSVVAMGHGAVWASSSGLIYVGSAGSGNVGASYFLQEDWERINPASIVGMRYGQWYFGQYKLLDGTARAFMVDPLNPSSLYYLDHTYKAGYYDGSTQRLYVLGEAGQVSRWDGSATAWTATYTSKVYRLPHPDTFTVAQVTADGFPCVVTVYTNDGRLVLSRQVWDSKPWRLPRGFTGDEWQVKVECSYPVTGVVLATSVAELG